ncbi:MAG: flagellar motor switch protein FliG [Planctomycetota bacterium]
MAKRQEADSGGTATVEMSGLTKAAILLITLDRTSAAAILRELGPTHVEELTREIVQLDVIDDGVRAQVIEDFYNVALARQYIKQGGISYARELLQEALPEDQASGILRTVERQVTRRPFSFLAKTDSENLLTFIQDEHPQTIALVLAHLSPGKASEILTSLAPAKQLEVITRIATMDNTNPEVIREVEEGLELRLSGIVSQTFQKAGGVSCAAEILNLSDRTTEKGIMEGVESQDADLAEQIRRLMFVFEDILLVNDKGIQAVLKEVDQADLTMALKTATPELREKVFRNMSERAAQLIKEDMEFMGPVRVSDVEGSQQKIVDVVRRLEDSGEVVISGRGGEKEMIV